MVIMERKITSRMEQWKDSKDRKPLMIMGPRQVGKTHSVMEFAKTHFDSYVLFNFQESPELHRIFERDLDPLSLLRELSAYSQETITDETLIVFDEIQECDRAVTSLKYFTEELPDQPIVTTGSLLGLTVGRQVAEGGSKRSFPVGKVQMIQMHPMDLEEYAWATGRRALTDSIRMHFDDMSEMPLHDTAIGMYREYLAVGGMPEAVSAYVRTGDPNAVITVQRGLNDSLLGDIAKHSGSSDTMVRTIRTWNSMVSQLMKDNLKFQYSKVASGGRSSSYSVSVDWLVAAQMVDRCDMVTEPTAPLSGFVNDSSFRLFMADVGLLCSKAEVPFKSVMSGRASDRFRGVMAENYVSQALTANGLRTYYWNPDPYTEVDFIFQDADGMVVPIEVRSGDRTGSKSLMKIRDRISPRSAIRFSSKNFGLEGGLHSIPLYAAFCVDDTWAQKVTDVHDPDRVR